MALWHPALVTVTQSSLDVDGYRIEEGIVMNLFPVSEEAFILMQFYHFRSIFNDRYPSYVTLCLTHNKAVKFL